MSNGNGNEVHVQEIKRKLNVSRAPRKFKDRLIEDAATKAPLYYCHHKEHLTNTEVTFHHYDINGPVVAIGVRKAFNTGAVINFSNPESEITVDPKAGFWTSVSERWNFKWQDKGYIWSKKGKIFKLEDEEGKLLVQFTRKHWGHGDGTMELYGDMPEDVIITTFIMYWYLILAKEGAAASHGGS